MNTRLALAFIATQADWLAHRPEAVEAFDELEGAIGLIKSAIDTAGDSTYAGPCDICSRDMYAKPGALEVECRPCALVYDLADRREWLLKQAEDRLETATNVARAITAYGQTLTPERIRQWKTRGRITAHGEDASGRPLFRIGDVLEVLYNTPDATQRAHA